MYARLLLFRLHRTIKQLVLAPLLLSVATAWVVAFILVHWQPTEYQLNLTPEPGWIVYGVSVTTPTKHLVQAQGLSLQVYHFYLKPGDYIINSLGVRGADHVPLPGLPVHIHLDHNMTIMLYGE